MTNKVAQMALRHTGEKKTITLETDEIVSTVRSTLNIIHQDLLVAAKKRLSDGTYTVSTYAEMKTRILASNTRDSENENEIIVDENSSNSEKIKPSAGFYLVPWKCNRENEQFIKEDCKATIRCYPLELNKNQPENGVKCFYSGEQATHMAIFARAF